MTGRLEKREQIARSLYALDPFKDHTGRAQTFDLAPPDWRELTYRQADAALLALQGVPRAAPTDEKVQDLAALLGELFYDRGPRIPDWPEDEAAAYRVDGWEAGHRAAALLVRTKAARALFAAGYDLVTETP